MLERLGRLCVGLGVIWVLVVVGLWLMVGLDRPEEWTPYLDRAVSSNLRHALYSLLTFVVTPIGMLMVLRDVFADPEPLWLKLSAPGAFAAVYALLLAAAVPSVGQPILLTADPIVARIFPGLALGQKAGDGLSWLARFGGLVLVIGVIPGVVGKLVGLLTRESRRNRWSP
jgi:hypothetical protein